MTQSFETRMGSVATRWLVNALSLSLTVVLTLLAGCGDSDPTGVASQQTIQGSVTAFGTTQHPFTTTRPGTLRVVLTWPNSAIDLDLYLTPGTCTADYPLPTCTLLEVSESSVGTSEIIQRPVSSGEQFKIWVDNFHETLASNYTLEITIR
jgi:uncharacterized protein YfaP (DUF2135 family)